MTGVVINALAVVIGSVIGLLFKKSIPQKLTDAIMMAIGLCVVSIGLSGILKGSNTLVLIAAMVCGTAVGTWADVDRWLNSLGDKVESRFSNKKGEGISISQGFVAGSLLMCVGAMAIVGSLSAGLTGDISTLLTKSVLDLISSALLVISLGVGVLFSAGALLVYQGSIVLLAQVLSPILSDAMVAEITCAGSLMILALGLNLLGVTKVKVANMLPAILFVPVFVLLFQMVGLG